MSPTDESSARRARVLRPASARIGYTARRAIKSQGETMTDFEFDLEMERQKQEAEKRARKIMDILKANGMELDQFDSIQEADYCLQSHCLI